MSLRGPRPRLMELAERVRNRVGAQLLAAPPPVLRLLAGLPRSEDGGPLDPQVQLLLRLAALSRVPELCDLGPSGARAMFLQNAPVLEALPPPLERVDEVTDYDLPMRLYVPKQRTGEVRPRGLLVWYHGGGFVVGGLDTHDAALRRLASEAGCLVLSVEYRKAPEHRFPAAVYDALAAFRWAKHHAGRLGADPGRVAVGGDSAGGNLAAVVAQTTRADGPPRLQVLVYPGTDLTRRHRSHRRFGVGYLLTARTIDWFVEQYLGADLSLMEDPRASPLSARDLSGLAPAIVTTAGFDPLRDEGDEYAERLVQAGVAVEKLHEPALVHGYFTMSALRAPREASARIGRLVRRALA